MAFIFRVICEAEKELSARDLAELFYDLTILHDRLVIYAENPAAPILYSPEFFRRWRRLPRGSELRVGAIRKASPMEIELIVVAVGGAFTFVQILRMLTEWPLELERRRLENLEKRLELLQRIGELRRAHPEFLYLIERDIRRILGNSIRIIGVEE